MTEYEIFKACFPRLVIDKNTFDRLAFPIGAVSFCVEGGFAVYKGERIQLLCVLPEYRGRGVGAHLLELCERGILSDGFKKAVLGGDMLPGAVAESRGFFERQGYAFGGEFNEMELRLSELRFPDEKAPCGARFGFFNGELTDLHCAVAEVDEEWVQYFDRKEDVFCGYDEGGELASFCIVGEDEDCLLCDGIAKVGSIGCVGTLPEFRRKGISLNMVAHAAELLKESGSGKVFIHWTHLDKWYAKLGAVTFLKFSPAEKELT